MVCNVPQHEHWNGFKLGVLNSNVTRGHHIVKEKFPRAIIQVLLVGLVFESPGLKCIQLCVTKIMVKFNDISQVQHYFVNEILPIGIYSKTLDLALHQLSFSSIRHIFNFMILKLKCLHQ